LPLQWLRRGATAHRQRRKWASENHDDRGPRMGPIAARGN
jgi:hypothetical protein